MAVNPIDIASVTRSTDYSIIKHNEDQRGLQEQATLVHREQKDTQQKAEEVLKQDNAGWQEKRFDAREKGNGEYRGDGGKKKKKPAKEQVIVNGHKGFDVKI